MNNSLQDPYLNILRREKVNVSIFLVNGIKLQGQIDSFDQFSILLRSHSSQLIYKHSISTVVPAKQIDFLEEIKLTNKSSGVKNIEKQKED